MEVMPAVGRGGHLVSTGSASRFLERKREKGTRMSPFGEIMLLASDGSGESDRAARMAVEFSRNLGSETPSRTPCWSISPEGPSPLVSSIPNGRDLDLAPEQRPQRQPGSLRGRREFTGLLPNWDVLSVIENLLPCCAGTEKQGHGPSTPPAPPSHHSQKGRAGSEQEPEVVPVPDPCLIVERELLPPTENVHDEDDRGRKTVPNAPKQVCPPHDVYLLYDRRSLTSSETSRPSRKSLLAVRSARRPTARGPTTVRRSGRATFSSPRAYLLDAGSAFDCMVQRASFPEQAWAFG